MTEAVTTTHDARPKRSNGAAKRDKVRKVADDVVTPNSLATHLGCTRQNIARLTAEAAIEQRSDGHYDQTASRLKYVKHLRTEHRRSPRTEADAEHALAKAALLRLRIAEKKRELIPLEEAVAHMEEVVGLFLSRLRDSQPGEAVVIWPCVV